MEKGGNHRIGNWNYSNSPLGMPNPGGLIPATNAFSALTPEAF
jgi:hypothetical protein